MLPTVEAESAPLDAAGFKDVGVLLKVFLYGI